MKAFSDYPSGLALKLRAKAERLLHRTGSEAAQMPPEDVKELVQELQVHQIELEMQNDELRRTQLELEKARARYADLYDFAPAAYLSLSANGEILEANLSAAHLLGVERSRLIHQKLARFLPPGVQDNFYLFCRMVFSSDTEQSIELELMDAKSKRLIVRLQAVRDVTNQRKQCRISFTDITERIKAEQLLRRSEQNLSAFFNHSPIGLQWLSGSGNILRANQAQIDMLGYSPEEYLGHFFEEFTTDPSVAQQLLEHLAANEMVSNVRLHLRRKDGAVRLVLVDAQSLWYEGQFLYSSIFSRDITENVNLEREILEIGERERRRIAHDLHDDLGQLLVGIAFLGSSLRQDLLAKSYPEARQLDRLLRVLDEAIGRTRSLARGLHPVKPEPDGLMVALKDLVSRTTTLFNIGCRLICRHPVLIEDNSTATHLYRIAQEAVTNAIKHGKPSRIKISLTRTPSRINLAIKDNGLGKSTRPRKNPGMGLRIMRYRAGAIGGSLAIQKTTGGGTTVVCTVHDSAATSAAAAPPRKQSKP